MADTRTIITISRQYGSGGRYIGRKLAEALDIPFYDKEIILRSAEESGISREIFEQLEKDYISGITFSGGDPLHPANEADVTALAREIREKYPSKDIWLYTGYRWEEICDHEIISYTDVLVDGRFILEQLDVTLPWKGSPNQRVIDVKRTLRKGKVVLFDEEEEDGEN